MAWLFWVWRVGSLARPWGEGSGGLCYGDFKIYFFFVNKVSTTSMKRLIWNCTICNACPHASFAVIVVAVLGSAAVFDGFAFVGFG